MVVIHPDQPVTRCYMNPWDESLLAVAGPNRAKSYRLDYSGTGSSRQVLSAEAGVSRGLRCCSCFTSCRPPIPTWPRFLPHLGGLAAPPDPPVLAGSLHDWLREYHYGWQPTLLVGMIEPTNSMWDSWEEMVRRVVLWKGLQSLVDSSVVLDPARSLHPVC